ncbi:MAG: di-heme oxidoredictase family protein [Gemmatimonadota bacterium]
MSGRRRALASGVGVLLTLAACEPAPPVVAAPGAPLPALEEAERGRFLLGRAVFERLATEEEGLGPLFNEARCSGCHDQPAIGGGGLILVRKATRWEEGTCDLLRAHGGDNLQARASAALQAAGLGPDRLPAEASDSGFALPPPLWGLGLLERVPEAVLRAHEDPEDRDGDGVSGRLGRTEDGRVGRFGGKADVATVRDFVESALRFELGFTTPDHLEEEGPNGQPLPPGIDPMPDPEIDAAGITRLVDFIQWLAPPEPLPLAAETESRGRQVFAAVGCTSCHLPELTTARDGPPWSRGVRLEPWTDLLLHDLGEPLRSVCGPGASPVEHRTPPLWGLGRRERFLHDGRAGTVDEAVRQHGGEAERVRDAYEALPEAERATLLEWLAAR